MNLVLNPSIDVKLQKLERFVRTNILLSVLPKVGKELQIWLFSLINMKIKIIMLLIEKKVQISKTIDITFK